jgi:hypothetical protein
VLNPDGPIVIGGLGGSGTRVVAAAVQASDVHLGHNLNAALDDRTASLIVNRPRSVAKLGVRGWSQLGLLPDLLMAGVRTPATLLPLLRMSSESLSSESLGKRLKYAIGGVRERGVTSENVAWGWKEPNSHLALAALAAFFSEMRFVLVVRHPLDMAFSTNLNQLANWGWMFGVEDSGPVGALDFWLRSTERAMNTDSLNETGRMIVVDYDAIVCSPGSELSKLVGALQLRPNNARLEAVADEVARPGSIGRHQTQDLSVFREDQLLAVQRLGWEIP